MIKDYVERNFYLFLIDAIACALAARRQDDFLSESTLSRTSILSSVFMLECCANILIRELGEEKFVDDLDRLPFLSKFEVYVRLKKGKIIDRDNTIVQKIEELKRVRDSIVHSKPFRSPVTKTDLEVPSDPHQIEFDIRPRKRKLSALSQSTALWKSEDAAKALVSVADFLKYFFVNLLEYNADIVHEMLASSLGMSEQTSDTRILMVETSLESWVKAGMEAEIDFSFLVHME